MKHIILAIALIFSANAMAVESSDICSTVGDFVAKAYRQNMIGEPLNEQAISGTGITADTTDEKVAIVLMKRFLGEVNSGSKYNSAQLARSAAIMSCHSNML